MANPVIIDIPGVGPVEATNAATEQTLRDILKAIQKGGLNKGGGGAGGAAGLPGNLSGGLSGVGKSSTAVGKAMGGLVGKLGLVANVAGQVAMKFLEVGAASAKLIKEFSNVGDDLEAAAGTFKMIPIVGGVLADSFGAVAQASQKTARAYQSAASAGASFNGSMNLFVKTASQAGLTMDQFGALVAKGGEGLLALGPTVEEGAKRFGAVSKQLRATGKDLYALGYSTEQINEGIVSYGKLLRAQGLARGQSDAQLAAGARNYLKEMDALAKVTGMSRQEAEQALLQQQQDAQFHSYMSNKNKDVRDSFATLLTTANKASPELAAMMKDYVTTGSFTNAEHAKTASLMGEGALSALQELRRMSESGEKISAAKQDAIFRQLAAAGKQMQSNFGETLAATGGEFDHAIKAQIGLNKLEEQSLEAARKSQDKAAQNQEKLNQQIEQAKQRLAALSNSFTMTLVNSGMLDKLLKGFESLAEFVNTVVTPIFHAFMGIVGPLVTFLANVFTPIFKTLSNLVETILMPFKYLGYLFDSVAGDTSLVKLAMEALLFPLNVLIGTVRLAFTAMMKIYDTIEDFLSPMFSFLGRMIDSVGRTIKDFFKPVIEDGATFFKKIMNALGSVLNPVIEVFRSVKKAVGDVFNSFNSFGEIITGIKLAFKSLGLNIKEMWYAIRDTIPGLTDTSKEERDALEKEKQALVDEKAAFGSQLERNRIENQKKEEEKQRDRDRRRDERDKTWNDLRTQRETGYYNDRVAHAKAEADAKKSVDWNDSLSVLKYHQGLQGQPGSSLPGAPGAATTPAQISQSTAQNMELIKAALQKQGITDPKYIAATLGNVMKETGGKSISENMNYGGTQNSRIRDIFGSRAAKYSDAELDVIKKDPTKMGELMYGSGTAMGKALGNTEPGDGWKYRGRGFIQLTGKTNYAAASRAIYGDNRLVDNPDLVNNPQVAAEVSAWYMKKGQSSMAGKLGINTANMTQAEANLLATSQIAGGDIRKKGKIGAEISAKVDTYSAQMANIAGAPVNTQVASSRTDMENSIAAQKQAAQQTAPSGKKDDTTASPGPRTTQESAESLLSSLNTKMDMLIRVTSDLNRVNERQLSVQQGLSGNLFA